MVVLLAACAPSRPLAVDVDGCAWLGVGPTCYLAEGGALTVWSPARPDHDAAWEAVDGGFRATLTPGDTLTVRAGDASSSWPIVRWTPPPAVAEAKRTGDTAPLLAALPGATGADRIAIGWALAALGADGWDLARVEREAAPEFPWWAARAALVQAHRATEVTGGSAEGLAAVARARAYRERVGGTLGLALDHSVDLYEGYAHEAKGDVRHAVEALERAEARAERGGRPDMADLARQHVAESRIRGGEGRAALEAMAAVAARVAPAEDPCGFALVTIEYAWGTILVREAGGEELEDPEPLLRRAVDALRDVTCPPLHDRAAYLAHAEMNLALVRTWRGDADGAARALAAAAEADPELDEPWALEIAGRVALLRGDPAQALATYDTFAARGEDQLELQWMAARGRGLALARLGRADEAIAALRDAQGLFFRQGLFAPIHLGRAAFYAQREQATRALAALLLAEGRPVEAFDAYRDQRAQYLAGLHQASRVEGGAPPAWEAALDRMRDARRALAALGPDWAVAVSELAAHRAARARLEDEARAALDAGNAALGVRVSSERRRAVDGEVLLGWFPSDAGWIGFAEHGGRVDVARWDGELPPADALLAPFTSALLAARSVTLLPFGPVGGLDLQAVQVGGAPLATRVPVRISLDLAPRPPGEPPRGRAVVLADPEGDLALARAQAERTAAALTRGGWTTERWTGEAATRAQAVAAMAGAGLVDFAGHGEAGTGWDSAIRLADGPLGIADLLALDPAPALVVIEACETARQADPGAVGVAQALVAAGARAVIAPERPVADALAARFAAAFYGRLADGAPFSEAYSATMAELAREPGDWASFRWIEP